MINLFNSFSGYQVLSMEFRVQFSISMVIAAVAAEVMSVFWYNDHSPWGRRTGDRFMLAAIISDAILVIILKFLTE